MHTFSSSKCYRSGSTWVSALVVIVVVLVVAAVLTPIFNHPKGPGVFRSGVRSSSCQSNLHELGIALTTYCGDYDGVLPSSKIVSGSKRWNKADFLKFGTRIGYLPPRPFQGKPDTYLEVIYDYIKNKDIVFCPDDTVDQQDPNAFCSYWWKLAVDKAWYGDGCKAARRFEKDFAYTADQIILYEHRAFHMDNQPALWNQVRINVVYMDSHVKSIELKNATSGDPANCAANSDGEPMYFNYNYDTGKGLPDDKTPAKWVDPAVYGDKL